MLNQLVTRTRRANAQSSSASSKVSCSIVSVLILFNLFLDLILVLCDSKHVVPQEAASLAVLTLCHCRTFPLTIYLPEHLRFAVQRWVCGQIMLIAGFLCETRWRNSKTNGAHCVLQVEQLVDKSTEGADA
jgi:hypothetical protein